jgi:hypothetical protein
LHDLAVVGETRCSPRKNTFASQIRFDRFSMNGESLAMNGRQGCVGEASGSDGSQWVSNGVVIFSLTAVPDHSSVETDRSLEKDACNGL